MSDDFELRVGDTSKPLPVVMKYRNSSGTLIVKNLTGHTVQFKMVNAATGAVKVAAGSATIQSATDGTAYYTFQSADVDTAGKYWASFVAVDGSARTDHYPVRTDEGVVLIHSDTQTAEEAYREALA